MAPPQLLLVEDDPQIVRAILPALEVFGMQVTVASDGGAALAQLDNGTWDAVVVDLGLPDMDGCAVLQHLRQTSGAFAVVISARHSSKDRLACELAGANHFLSKPFATPELIGHLQTGLSPRNAAHPD